MRREWSAGADSAIASSGCVRRKKRNAAVHTTPKSPVTTKADRQPHVSVIHATTGGASTAPRLDPLLQIPIASMRASGGTQVATDFANAGQAPASPIPKNTLNHPRLTGPRTSAVAISATDHHAMESVSPRPTPTLSSAQPA